ncbi:MAG: hypothetical protein QM820_15005 [Minicystis sp.]
MRPTSGGGWEARERYLSTGHIAADLLRTPIFRAWERSHLLGVDARVVRLEALGPADTERLLDRRRAFAAAARPYMDAIAQAAGPERFTTVLADADAILLDAAVDARSAREPGGTAVPGSLLSEASIGANGVGSPLAEGGYLEIAGSEHFVQGFESFTCQGLPVRGADRRIAGVLTVATRFPAAARRLREILVCAAHGIEAELSRRRLEEDVRRLADHGDADAALVERLRQDIVQSQAAARIRVEAAAISLARSRAERAAEMIRLAEASIDGFRRQTDLWHCLAAADEGAPGPVALDRLVNDLLLLLHTEAAVSGIAVEPAAIEPVIVRADARRLARHLFRVLLRAFDAARGGGAVRVEVQRRGGAEIVITSIPPVGLSRAPGDAHLILLPLSDAEPLDPGLEDVS